MDPILTAGVPDTPRISPETQRNLQDARLREVSLQLEASFVSEMLKAAGLDAREGSFGGGPGEEQFTSFLRQAQAERIAESGGLGLAEHIFRSLKAQANGND